MKVDRYLAIAGTGEQAGALREHGERAGQRLGLVALFAAENLVVLASPETLSLSLDRAGVVIGRVVPRSPGTSPDALTAGVRNTSGRLLTTAAWGDYVAFVRDRGEQRLAVLRSPSGGVHAFHARQGDLTFFASDAAMLLDLGTVPAAVDWDFVAHHLAFPHLVGASTGVAGIGELFPGEQIALGDTGERRTQLWSPWAHVGPAAHPGDYDELCTSLRDTVRSCVSSLAQRYSRVVLELSGGLDSSIVAAGLRERSTSVRALNLVTPTAEGDERVYAQLVASHLGFSLDEAAPAAEVDLAAPLEARYIRPGLPGVLRAWEGGCIGAAVATGAEAFVSGTGGDNVFCALGSAAPAADALLGSGPGRRFLRAVSDVASVHRTSWWTAATMAVRQARRRDRGEAWPRAAGFLRADALPRDPPFHPWLAEAQTGLVGKRSHVRSIMAAGAHLDGYTRHRVAPSVFPLLAQPVVEACLAIPTWTWVRGGRDRAVARDAFRGELPATILDRQTKGMMNAYCARAFQRNREALRPFLLAGHLARAGFIDQDRLAPYLAATGPVRDIEFYGVLTLADVELWLRSWLGEP